ncbi:MAG: fructose-6-phosphate aldolase [Deltaproteobacteria bacterium]|nr:fructose-6-phosphate aldolase [Deltaproteobacteria bacterium]
MKIFIDTADVQEIREANDMGILDGVTTNPSLIAKSGRKFRDVIEEIVKIVDGPISAEVVSLDHEGMMKEAREYAKIHSNVVIKLPMTVEGLKALKICVSEKIKTNITLVFNANQALLVGKVGATFVSPFIGRLDDISQIGMDLIRQIRTIYNNYGIKTQILAASIRNPIHFLESALVGADVATVPMSVIKQLTQHPLTDLGIERFLKDWEKVPK